jgi:membrane protein
MQMVGGLGGVVPSAALSLITDQLGKLTDGEQGGLLPIGLLTALWSSSAAMTAIIDTLNTAYDIEEGRPWWKVRLTAIALTIGLALFIVVAFALVVAGPTLAERLADRWFLGAAFEWTWKIVQWPLVFALVSGAIAIVYYFAPDAEQDWVWITPGSIVATILWLIASLGFKYYIANFGGYESYGIIGGVMVLMLWFYLSGLVILVGAEMNAEIEHASPYGKQPGEKVPGERRTIGPALKRMWEARQGKGATRPALPVRASQPASVTAFASARESRRHAGEARQSRSNRAGGGGWSAWIIGAPVVMMQALWTLKSYRQRVKS